MDNLTLHEMMDAHVNLNLGTYFDDRMNYGPINIVTSRSVRDIYWNFAYVENGGNFDESSLKAAIDGLAAAGRAPAIWQPSLQVIPAGWAVQCRDAWMWIAADDWTMRPALRAATALVISEHEKPSHEMVSVFNNAYCSEVQEHDVGYGQLPLDYSFAYENSAPKQPAVLRHFSGTVDGLCVCIGTAGVWCGTGGIYSVATKHGYRKRGFAKELTYHATNWTIANGARGSMLITIADSPVETLYAQLGYKTVHVGGLLTP